jgi:hypothetical protein
MPERETEVLIGSSKEIHLKVNTEKTKYMLISCHLNAELNHDVKTALDFMKIWQNSNICVAELKYLGMTAKYQN